MYDTIYHYYSTVQCYYTFCNAASELQHILKMNMQKHKLVHFFQNYQHCPLFIFLCVKEQGTTSNFQNRIWLPFGFNA